MLMCASPNDLLRMWILSRDAYGNVRFLGGDMFSVEFASEGITLLSSPNDFGNGTYYVEMPAPTSAPTKVRVMTIMAAALEACCEECMMLRQARVCTELLRCGGWAALGQREWKSLTYCSPLVRYCEKSA